jgi:hypothetical protein
VTATPVTGSNSSAAAGGSARPSASAGATPSPGSSPGASLGSGALASAGGGSQEGSAQGRSGGGRGFPFVPVFVGVGLLGVGGGFVLLRFLRARASV